MATEYPPINGYSEPVPDLPPRSSSVLPSQEAPALPARPLAESQNLRAQGEPEFVEAHEVEHATISHELANEDHDEKGAAQLDHGQIEVKDLGWNEHHSDVPVPVVGGLPNEELWTLIRRFNKVGGLLRHFAILADPE